MSVNEVAVEEPFAPSVADEEVELRALCRALTLGDGFSLLFSRCNQADHRRELIDKVRENLPDLNVQVVDLREPINHLLDELRERLTDTAPDAIFVLGLEYSLRTSDEAHSSPLIANLNASRNSFPRVVRCPMVLWVPEYIVTAISRGAPDFFSIRSGLYSFAAAPKDSMNVVQSVMAGDWIGVQNLSLAEKQERVESIRSLLADYESLPGDKRDLSTEMALHYRLGSLLFALGSHDEALAASLITLRRAEQLGARAYVAAALHLIGTLHELRGEYAAALVRYERSLKILEELGNRAGMATLFRQLGTIHQQRGEYDAALEIYEQSLKINEELGDQIGIAGAMHQIGIIKHLRGEYDAAIEMYERSLKIVENLGNQAGVAGALYQIGLVHEHRGEYDEALDLYEQALKIAEELGDRRGVAISLHQIGSVRELRGEYGVALEQYERSLKISEELGYRVGVATSLHQIGIVHQHRGEYDSALEQYERSLNIREELGDREGVASSLNQIGVTRALRAEYPEAFQFLRRALVIAVDLGSPFARTAVQNLKALRAKWGAENFDAAWQQAQGEPVPAWLK